MTESAVNQAGRTVTKPTLFILTLLLALLVSAQNQITSEKVGAAKRAEVFEQTLPALDYRKVGVITVEYKPGGTSPSTGTTLRCSPASWRDRLAFKTERAITMNSCAEVSHVS